MAEYLHSGRGVVKPRQCEHSRVLLVHRLTLLSYCLPIHKKYNIHINVSIHLMKPRWPNIFIQEGVWSNLVIHRDSETEHSRVLLVYPHFAMHVDYPLQPCCRLS